MNGLEIFDLAKAAQKRKFQTLAEKRPGIQIIDTFQEQLKELFLVRHPKLKLNLEEAKEQTGEFLARKKRVPLQGQGKWVYFEWNNTLVHILSEPDFFELRTARNKNLITKEEQGTLKEFRVGIAGLSVGNSIALALALEGFESMRLADFDELSLSNLNRIRGSITQLGLNKTIMTARHIYELNPYAKLELLKGGLTGEKELKKFIAGPPKLQLLIDEIDDVIMKIQLRVLAKKLGIPVFSATDNGDNAIVDVERFDLEPERKLYHGLLGDIENENLESLNVARKMKLISGMVGAEYVTSRMKNSFLQVGITLYGWPQLGGAAMLSGSVLVYLAKTIALGKKLRSGKYDVSLNRIFENNYDSPLARARRKKETQHFLMKQNRAIFNE